MMKVNDEFILDIKRIGINGEGIGYYNKMAVFVNNAIPGEGVKVKVTKLEKNMAFAEVVEYMHKSEFRETPICKFYSECGGCQLMHIAYEKTLEYKKEILIEALNRYTKLNTKSFEIKNTIPSASTLGYRNRSLMPLRETDYHNIRTTMIKEGTNHQIDVDECLIHNDLINDINKEIIKIASMLKISVYSNKNKEGILRYLSVRVNENDEALVTFVMTKETKETEDLCKKTSEIDYVKGVYVLLNNSFKPGNILEGKLIHKYNQKYIVMTSGKIKYNIYPNTFFQLNSNQAQVLNELVLKNLKLSRKEKVLDIYCGVGFISLYISHLAKEVVGIEYEKSSITSAKENAVINKIKNTRFYSGDAAEVLTKLLKEETFDNVVLDPPRSGLDDKMIDILLNNEFKKIIYVSCNPATLAKNLDKLSLKYNVNKIEILDMFPNTSNVESIALLQLKDSAKNYHL